jgi:prepilin-type N-terminal cleavage/methylation domain-containing protein
MRRSRVDVATAFTMPELLVVVAIIAVLVALLVPVVSRLRVRSKRTACKATLAQLGHAMEMYRGANRGKFPRALILPWIAPIPQQTQPAKPVVSGLLGPYVANAAEAFHCVADDLATSKAACFKRDGLSYAYNESLGDQPLEQTPAYDYARTPSKMAVMWDADFFHGGHAPTKLNDSDGDFRWNYLFADGHVAEYEKSDPNGLIIVLR